MSYRNLALAGAALLLGACRPSPTPMTYRCGDGRIIQARYPDTGHALVTVGGRPHRLTIARSASGARYTGAGWQWWTKGLHEAWLAPLRPGESLASAPGVACRVPAAR